MTTPKDAGANCASFFHLRQYDDNTLTTFKPKQLNLKPRNIFSQPDVSVMGVCCKRYWIHFVVCSTKKKLFLGYDGVQNEQAVFAC